MRALIVATVLRREWSETVRNRLLMSTILIPPMVLTIAPLALAGVVGDRSLRGARHAGVEPATRVGGVQRLQLAGASRSNSSSPSSC